MTREFETRRPVRWLLLFLVMDRTDECQLTHFTVLYRGAAFISIGILWAVTGFFRLIRCTTAQVWTCDVDVPGVSAYDLNKTMLAMARMLLGSVAFALLVRVREHKQRNISDVTIGLQRGSTAGMALGFILSVAVAGRGYWLLSSGKWRANHSGTFDWVRSISMLSAYRLRAACVPPACCLRTA